MLPKKFQLILVFVSVLMNMVGFGIVMPLLPFFTRELGGGSFDMGMLVAVWALAQVVTSPRWGAFSDRVGRRPTLVLGLVGTAGAFTLIGLSSQLWMLYMARGLGGLISAATIPSAYAYVADVTPPEHRSARMGQLGAMFGLGFMLGPSIGGIMAPLGISRAFFAAAFVTCLTAVLIHLFLKEPEERTVTAAGETRLLQRLLVAIKKPYASLLWIAFFIAFAGSVLLTVMAFFLADRFGAGEGQVGLIFTLNAAVGVLTQAVLIVLMVKRLGEVQTLRIGMWCGLLGFLVFSFSPNMVVILMMAVLLSVGQSLGRPLTVSLLSLTTDMGQGTTMGLKTSFEAMGRVVGPLWAGWLYQRSMQAPFISSAVIFLIALLFVTQVQSLLAQERGHKAQSELQQAVGRNS